MKDHYDFSKAKKKGLFYIGNQLFDILIQVDSQDAHSRFEVYSDSADSYRFRLLDDQHTVFTSDAFPSKEACLHAISELRANSFRAPTVFA